MKKNKFFYSLSFISIAAFGLFFAVQKFVQHNRKPPNIIVISLCSLGSQFLPIFGNAQDADHPILSAFFAKSFNFTNAITDLSWSNISRFTKRENPDTIRSYGYNGISNQKYTSEYDDHFNENNFYWRWPPFTKAAKEEDLSFGYDEHFIGKTGIEELISLIDQPTDKPFYVVAHLKYMHFPYLDFDLRDPKIASQFLEPDEIQLLLRYQKNYSAYLDKFPFFEVLFFDEEFRKAKQKHFDPNFILSSDSKSIERWQRSKDFQTDLKILKKIYNHKLSNLEVSLKKFMDLYHQKFEKNTVLVLSADHGEAFLEHGLMTHAFKPFDEIIKFFFSIHFPGQDFRHDFKSQISQNSLASLVFDLIKKPLFVANEFTKRVSSDSDPFIYSYNCTGSQISARFKNKWKLIYDFEQNQAELFDLENDPKEILDMSASNTELVQQYKVRIDDELTKMKYLPDECIFYSTLVQ